MGAPARRPRPLPARRCRSEHLGGSDDHSTQYHDPNPAGSGSSPRRRNPDDPGACAAHGDGDHEAALMEFEIRRSNSTSQPYYWRIVASNGQVLATSETYVNKSDALSAVNSVKANAAGARTVDLT